MHHVSSIEPYTIGANSEAIATGGRYNGERYRRRHWYGPGGTRWRSYVAPSYPIYYDSPYIPYLDAETLATDVNQRLNRNKTKRELEKVSNELQRLEDETNRSNEKMKTTLTVMLIVAACVITAVIIRK